MKIIAISAAVAALLVAGTANAVHYCSDPPIIDTGVAYVFDDCTFSGECFYFTLWVYAESNGEPGAQRGGYNFFGDADFCQTTTNPDSAVL